MVLNLQKDVLVIPTRPAVRLADLTQEELSALFSAVQKVGKAVETAYKADALTVALQVCYHFSAIAEEKLI
jgi:diadenosine tetraphosphate (Ap4A) HIT family hydrolase